MGDSSVQPRLRTNDVYGQEITIAGKGHILLHLKRILQPWAASFYWVLSAFNILGEISNRVVAEAIGCSCCGRCGMAVTSNPRGGFRLYRQALIFNVKK